jgi:hypothetical protein
MYRCLIAALTALTFVVSAQAQTQRPFPQNALRGTVVFGTPPDIKLGGKPAQLAPGYQIRNADNLLAMSGGLTGGEATVNYTLDEQGLVKRIWILRPDEVAVKPWPTTPEQAQKWQFDAAAQTWSKP